MPELPEVETVRRQLAERVLGRTFTDLEVPDLKFPLPDTPEGLARAVLGRRIEDVGRRGKYLLLRLDSGDCLCIHLRMTGRLHWSPGAPDEAERFVRAVFHLDDGSLLTFSDMRRFGRGWIIPGGGDPEEYWRGRVGVEPLGDGFTPAVLGGLLARRRGPVKAVLLNQALVAGLGNIYVDEALFQAGVHPERPAGDLGADEVALLHEAIVDRLQVAVAAGGSSIDSYRDSLGAYGSMQDRLRVHLHRGDPCPRCGEAIIKTRVAQRGTYLCPGCQRR